MMCYLLLVSEVTPTRRARGKDYKSYGMYLYLSYPTGNSKKEKGC